MTWKNHQEMTAERDAALEALRSRQMACVQTAKERDAALAEVERLRAWAVSVRETAYHQTYPGSRYVCRFCGALEHCEHNSSCLMAAESKEGGA